MLDSILARFDRLIEKCYYSDGSCWNCLLMAIESRNIPLPSVKLSFTFCWLSLSVKRVKWDFMLHQLQVPLDINRFNSIILSWIFLAGRKFFEKYSKYVSCFQKKIWMKLINGLKSYGDWAFLFVRMLPVIRTYLFHFLQVYFKPAQEHFYFNILRFIDLVLYVILCLGKIRQNL